MKRLLLGTALALFGLVPTIGSACEYQDASMASSAAYAQLGLEKTPPASKASAPVVAKAPVVKQAKRVGDNAPSPAPHAKLAAVATNH
jgi:hypothetical protein